MLEKLLEILKETNEEIRRLKPYENEYSCRLQDPSKFDSFARKNCFKRVAGKCLDFIFGIKDGKSSVQAYRYKKSVWTKEQAKSHCKSAGGSFDV